MLAGGESFKEFLAGMLFQKKKKDLSYAFVNFVNVNGTVNRLPYYYYD